jgi:hypothetical protein
MSQDISQPKRVGTWRKVLAAIFDFFTILFAAGYGVAYFTGGLTPNGFQLNGGPALLAFAIIVLYFVIFSKFLGGTLWQRIFGVR